MGELVGLDVGAQVDNPAAYVQTDADSRPPRLYSSWLKDAIIATLPPVHVITDPWLRRVELYAYLTLLDVPSIVSVSRTVPPTPSSI